MARNGSGGYSLPYPTFTSGTLADATQVTANNADLTAAIAQSLSKDGQTTPTANLPMGTYKLTGMGVGSAATDSANLGQIQAQAYTWAGTAAGTADELTLTVVPAITAYATGQRFRFKAGASNNTGAATVAVSGLVAKAMEINDAALSADDILANKYYDIFYDGTAFQMQRVSVKSLAASDIGTTVQAYDADLTTIAGLSPTDGQVLTYSGSEWTAATASSASETDVRLLALQVAELSGDRLNMVDGIADPYVDATDIDTSLSANELFVTSGGYFIGAADGTTVDGGHTTPGVSGSGNTTIYDRSFALTNGKFVSKLAIYNTVAQTYKLKIGLENSSTDIDTVVDQSIVHTGSGWEEVTLSSPFLVPASGTYRLGSYGSSNSSRANGSAHNIASYTGDATGTGETYSASSNYARFVRATYADAAANLVLVSDAFTADSEPDTARLHVQVKENEAITVNTDLTGEASRDDGTTWTSATLALVETLADGTKAYEDSSIDISGQPSGTDMRYRIKTLNTKDIEIHGTIEQWS